MPNYANLLAVIGVTICSETDYTAALLAPFRIFLYLFTVFFNLFRHNGDTDLSA